MIELDTIDLEDVTGGKKLPKIPQPVKDGAKKAWDWVGHGLNAVGVADLAHRGWNWATGK